MQNGQIYGIRKENSQWLPGQAGGGGNEAYWGQSFDSARRKVLEVCGSPPCIHQTLLTGWWEGQTCKFNHMDTCN